MVSARRVAAALSLAALLLAGRPAAAQDPAPAPEAPRRVLLFFEPASGAELDPSQLLLVYESLLVKLGRASGRVLVIEYGNSSVPSDDRERRDAAESRRADSWVRVTVDGRWPELAIAVQAFDLLAGAPVLDRSFRKTIRRGAVDLERRFWDEVTDAVVSSLPGSGRRAARAVTLETLTVQGVAGTRIRGLGGEVLRIGDGGQAQVETLLPATLSLRATRRGYDPLNMELYLEPGAGLLHLEQEPASRWALSFYLQMMNYPGFDASWYPVPDLFWVKLGLNTYLLGLVLAGGREQDMLVSFSLSHVNLSTGVYLNAADRLFRYYLGLGAFARILTARGPVIAFEPIAPWGLQPVLGVEISRRLKRRFYVEYAPFFYVPNDPTLFRLSIRENDGPPILPIPEDDPKLFWETFVFRFGLRWLL